MHQKWSRNVAIAAIAAMSASHIENAAADTNTDGIINSIDLEMPNREVVVVLKNTSGSLNLLDFELGASVNEITFPDMKASIRCGYWEYGLLNYRWKGHAYREDAEVWVGSAGKPQMHKLDKGTVYSGTSYPTMLAETWEYENSLFPNSYRVFKRGNRFDLTIPYEKLRHPDDDTSPAIDGETIFNEALNSHLGKGGNYVQFFREDHTFVVDVPVTLGAPCMQWWEGYGYASDDQKKHFDFDEQIARIIYKYEGNPNLVLQPKVAPEDGGVQTPVFIDSVSIDVNPPKSTGICPRNVTATARVRFDKKSATKRTLRYRFTEDGEPVTAWMERSFVNRRQLAFTHEIEVTSNPQSGKGGIVTDLKYAPDDGLETIDQIGLQQKPVVGIEIIFEGQQRFAADQYEAYCSKPVEVEFDPNYPGQPDLLTRGALQVGLTSAPWGTSMTLSIDEASDVTPRGCTFRYFYPILNVGTAGAGSFTSNLRRPGAVLHRVILDGLNAATSDGAAGAITLPSGEYKIWATIDTHKEVSESDEENNVARMLVTVPEACGGGDPRPQ